MNDIDTREMIEKMKAFDNTVSAEEILNLEVPKCETARAKPKYLELAESIYQLNSVSDRIHKLVFKIDGKEDLEDVPIEPYIEPSLSELIHNGGNEIENHIDRIFLFLDNLEAELLS